MTARPQIVGLGLAVLDMLLRMHELPAWEHNASLDSFRFDGGGPVGTAMVAAARLGARVGFIGTAGSDAAAELKLQSFRAAGVDLSHLVRHDGPEDQVTAVFVHADSGERTFAGLPSARHTQIDPAQLDREFITAADYLHLDGSHFAAALQAARWMHEAGKTVVMDGARTSGPVKATLRELVPYVDVLITGEGFARALTGHADIGTAGRAVLTMGPRIVVETVGARGCDTITPEVEFHTPAFPVAVVDTTGAGDVFHGAYIVGLLHGWDARQCALFASAVAALKCTRLGGRAGIPTFEQTLAFLRERGVELTGS